MKFIYILAILLVTTSLFHIVSYNMNLFDRRSNVENTLQSNLLNVSNLTLLYILSGYVTNTGGELLFINETDIMIFDYPLDTDDQRVSKIQTFVNNNEYNYSIIETSGSRYILINSPYYNYTLKPSESINVSVRYYVSINVSRRISNILDFYRVDDPYKLLNKAGVFSDLVDYINETTTGLTTMWNYTNPLIKLLVKYFNRSITSNRPLVHLFNILDWVDKNIVYSTRIPPRSPWEVITEGAGDCDDQSNLLITLLRAFKIPSYLEIGVVFISEHYYVKRTEASGYYSYEFIGGGGHGWVAVYIPPWGWIRVDPIVRRDPFTDEKAPLYRVGIKYALYYLYPTVVLDRVFERSYVEESVKFLEEIKTKKITIHLVMEVYRLEQAQLSKLF